MQFYTKYIEGTFCTSTYLEALNVMLCHFIDLFKKERVDIDIDSVGELFHNLCF